MLAEYLISAAVIVAVGFLTDFIAGLRSRWGEQHLPAAAQIELSDDDQKMVEKTQTLITHSFGNDVVDTLRNASNKDRIALFADFAEQLAALYGLDITVDVTVNNLKNCGAYNWSEKKAVFNIAMLTVDGNHPHFAFCVKETLDTIVHELRHAVQHRVVEEPGFWNVDEKRRLLWARNMTQGHYIKPEVDLRAYAGQPIEKDASTFAAAVMEGV